MTFTPEVWDGVVRRLRLELPPFICDAFIANLVAEPAPDGVRVVCPTAFHRDRIRDHYRSQIAASLRAELGLESDHRLNVEIVVDRANAQTARTTSSPRRPTVLASVPRCPASTGAQAATAVAPRPVQRPLLRSQHTFESFVVGDCNALAREASLAIVREDDPNLSQLFLCSASGLGKTHLARAVCNEARANGRRAVYTSAEEFTNEFLASLRSRQTARFKRKFRHECDVLIVEDVGFLQGKESTQLEFFHTVQHLREAGGRMLFTSTRLPRALTELDPRVRTQLGDGFLAEMRPPDAHVRRDILRAKAAAGGVHLPDESIELLVESVRGSVRELESVLIQLVTTASLMKKRIDLALTREALEKKGADAGVLPRLDLADVIALVAASFDTTPEQLAGRTRRKEILVPRQLAMYLGRRYTDASLAEIGRALNRDHPSIRNAIQKVERAVLEKAPLRYQVEELARKLDELSRR